MSLFYFGLLENRQFGQPVYAEFPLSLWQVQQKLVCKQNLPFQKQNIFTLPLRKKACKIIWLFLSSLNQKKIKYLDRYSCQYCN